jgi:GTP cyclohydrolase II
MMLTGCSTCRPYLIYGIDEAVKEAQKGGSGVVIYFRKEGRALGEVTKVKKSYEVLHRTAATDTLPPLNPFGTFLHIPHTLFQSHTL